MTQPVRAPLYDLFKMIVTIILLILFLMLLSRTPPPIPTPSITDTATASETPTASVSSTATFTPTRTITPSASPTNTPSPTATASLTATPTPIEITAEPSACEAVSRSRLTIGDRATILRRLNFRSSPGIMDNWILTNIPGTPIEIVGGPVCTTYPNGGAYLWWQIKLPSEQIGWSAEASAFGRFYFMEPVR